jgi:cytochrome c biogenesis protein CcmG, thiol:disulfide interchange protein DsbE
MLQRDRFAFLLAVLAATAGCGRSVSVDEKPPSLPSEESPTVPADTERSESATEHDRSGFSPLEEDWGGDRLSTEAILGRYSDTVQSIQTFRVRQVVQRAGEIQPDPAYDFVVQKPNRIFVRQPQWYDGPVLKSDGSNLLVTFPAMKKFIKGAAPDTFLPFLTNPSQISDRAGTSWYHMLTFFPLHLAIGDAKDFLLRHSDSCDYLGRETVDGQPTDRLRFHRADSQWDLWIAARPPYVPVRMERDDWSPKIIFRFENWQLNSTIDSRDFRLSPPPGDYQGHEITLQESFRETIGKAAPEFVLTTIQNAKVELKEFRGKMLLLDFWATWCEPCQREIVILQEFANEFPEEVSLLAITSEDRDAVVSFMERSGKTFPIAFDENSRCANQYGVSAIPHLVVIDQQGIVQRVFVGLEANLSLKLRELLQQSLESTAASEQSDARSD